MKALVIGYGNTLRGDDAVGRVVADSVERAISPDQAKVLIVHQLTPELAEDLAESDLIIFIDASENVPPGEVRVLRLMDSPAVLGESSHAVDPAWLLYTVRVLYGRAPDAYAVVVGGSEFGLVEGLSPEARRGAAVAIERVIELIEERGNARNVAGNGPC